MAMPAIGLDILSDLKNMAPLSKGAFIAVTGLVGVFLVLVLFYATTRILELALREKAEEPGTDATP